MKQNEFTLLLVNLSMESDTTLHWPTPQQIQETNNHVQTVADQLESVNQQMLTEEEWMDIWEELYAINPNWTSDPYSGMLHTIKVNVYHEIVYHNPDVFSFGG